jgi:hypothetical protein
MAAVMGPPSGGVRMKAVAVFPGKVNSMHLTELPKPALDAVPNGRGALDASPSHAPHHRPGKLPADDRHANDSPGRGQGVHGDRASGPHRTEGMSTSAPRMPTEPPRKGPSDPQGGGAHAGGPHPSSGGPRDPEHLRLAEARVGRAPWHRWGPYLAERQWGTVREDYSALGTAWEDFPHKHFAELPPHANAGRILTVLWAHRREPVA